MGAQDRRSKSSGAASVGSRNLRGHADLRNSSAPRAPNNSGFRPPPRGGAERLADSDTGGGVGDFDDDEGDIFVSPGSIGSPAMSSRSSPSRRDVKRQGNKTTWLDDDEDPFYGKHAKHVGQMVAAKNVAKRLGPRSLKEWMSSLRRQYGNLVRAWRMALDTDGNGSLTYTEFGPAVRALGYEGSIRDLWRELDDDGGGEVSLAEFDPTSAKLLGRFKAFLQERFADAQTIWLNIAVRGQPTLTCEAFESGMKVVGWDYRAKELHSILDSSLPGCKMVGIKDIYWLGVPSTKPSMHPVTALKLRQEAFRKLRTGTMGVHSAHQFKAYLRRLCGNTVRAWRLKLDSDGNGSLTYNEFGPAVRSLGYEGSVKALWQELDDDDGGQISLNELCPRSAQILESFKVKLLEQFTTAASAWRRLAPGGSKTLTRGRFREACQILGWQGPADVMHKMLDSDIQMSGHIGIHDLQWLGQFETGASID